MMKGKVWAGLAIATAFIISCGNVSDFGSDYIGEYNSVILYVTGIEPQPLQSDVVLHTLTTVGVNAVDPTVEISGDGIGNDNGVCEPGEICCGDIGPGNPVFQTQCCVAVVQEDLCLGEQFTNDSVNVSFILEPKKDFSGNPVSPNTSPVLIESVDISFNKLTPECPDIPNISEAVNMTVQPDQTIYTFALSVISQSLKAYIYSFGTTQVITYTNIDGCVTSFTINEFPYLCEYNAELRFYTVELFGGDREIIPVSLSIKLSDFQSQNECQI